VTTALTRERAYRVFLLLNFTRWFPVGFVVGIFILLQTNRGLSIAQAMTAAAVSGFVCFALELPTSGFADAFGRRAVYVAAAGINVVTGLAYLFAQSFWQFVGAAALMGAFRALDSGPLEAWFVDTVHESAPGADVDQELSRQGTVLGVGMAVGALLSGALIWWHPIKAFPAIDLAVAVFAALNVIHLIATLTLLKEAPRPVSSGDRERRALASVMEAPAVIRGGLLLLARNRVLLGLIGAEICWSVGMVAFESLLPLRLEEMLGSAQAAGALMGPVAAVGWGIFALGTWLAGRLSKRWGVARAAMLGRGLNALGVVVMGLTLTPAQLVGLSVHLHHARAQRPAALGAAPSRGLGPEPLDGVVDQLDVRLPRLRHRRPARRPPRRPRVHPIGDAHGGAGLGPGHRGIPPGPSGRAPATDPGRRVASAL